MVSLVIGVMHQDVTLYVAFVSEHELCFQAPPRKHCPSCKRHCRIFIRW